MSTLQKKAVGCQGPAVLVQGVLPGMEALFRPAWSPQPHILASVQNYLRGFAAHGKAIYARRKHIAAKLGIAVRTLARYLAHLHDVGWLETVKRTARTAIRKVAESKVLRPFSGPSIEVTPEVPRREVLSTRQVEGRHHQRTDDADFLRRMEAEHGPEAVRTGILLGKARRLIHEVNTGTLERVRSVRYFAGAIAEAARGLPAGYAEHLEKWLQRHRSAA